MPSEDKGRRFVKGSRTLKRLPNSFERKGRGRPAARKGWAMAKALASAKALVAELMDDEESTMGRKFFVGGNWKLNGTKASIDGIIQFLNASGGAANVDVVVAPPAPYLSYVKENVKNGIEVAAQNAYKVPSGAFTGEISPAILNDLGIKWVILGHSERRHIFGEADLLIAEKTIHALENKVNVIYCVGEKLEEREAGQTKDVNFRQLQALVDKKPDWTNVVIAYEPVWAIGTGKTASPDQAQEVHQWIRDFLSQKVSPDVAEKTRIIYGGSVTADNAAELGKKPDIDGFLVGGASLKPDFVKIINARN